MKMTMDRSSDAADVPPKPSGRSSRPPRSRTIDASSSTSSSELLTVGRVGRPHGLDGSFYVYDVAPELPASGGIVSGRRIVRRAGTAQKPILRLEGSSSREDAEALRGLELTVPRTDQMLADDEFWASDVEGCAVVSGEAPVGVVRRMLSLPSVDVLEVEREDGSELLVPMVRDCIRALDLEARRIDIDLEFLGES
jgi:16S rRNA processing protein RimM